MLRRLVGSESRRGRKVRVNEKYDSFENGHFCIDIDHARRFDVASALMITQFKQGEDREGRMKRSQKLQGIMWISSLMLQTLEKEWENCTILKNNVSRCT